MMLLPGLLLFCVCAILIVLDNNCHTYLDAFYKPSFICSLPCSSSGIIITGILVLVLKCSKPQNHEVSLIISIKQSFIEINPHLTECSMHNDAIAMSSNQHPTDEERSSTQACKAEQRLDPQ